MIKKVIFTLLSIFAILPLSAEKVTIPIKWYKGNTGKVDQPVKHRSPMVLPIEVVYDNETMTVEIFCVNDVQAEVSVYNAFEELEGYSPCLNSVISLTESDYHTIVIEGEDWTATGVIE